MNATASAADGVSIRRVATASLIGTSIEFYDFYIFATAAALIFNKIFFPSYDSATGTLAAFGALAAAFFARPIGGIIFGHFGDRVGRKAMLVTSLMIMGTATVAIGLLPTYDQIGPWAPTLLVIARLLQGIGVGGEFGGAVLMATEHAPQRLKAFYGSWPLCGVSVGMVLSSGVFFLVQLMPEDQLLTWGWRIPFLASAILVAVGLYIRVTLPETPQFEEVKQDKQRFRFPVIEVIKTGWRQILIGVGALAVTNVFYYIAAVFVLSYRAGEGVSRGFMLIAVCIAATVEGIGILVAALLADKFGYRKIIAAGCAFAIVFAFPFFWMINTRNPVLIIVALSLACGIGVSMTYAPIGAFLSDLFAPNVRYSGLSVSYQASGAFISGMVPIISLMLLEWSGSSWSLSLYIAITATISLLVVLYSSRSAAGATDADNSSARPSERDAMPNAVVGN